MTTIMADYTASAHTTTLGDDGDWLSIPDNRHPLRRDTNPYVYPYFHSGDGPSARLLYDWIVEFADFSKAYLDSSAAATAANHDDRNNNNMVAAAIHTAELQRRLVRRVEARCLSHPHELLWSDSCGDTALHRLAQMARMVSAPSFNHHHSPSHNLEAAADHNSSANNHAHWILRMAKCIIRANVDIVTVQNSWKETPLHQFVQHCGLPHQALFREDHGNEEQDDATTTTNTSGRHHPYDVANDPTRYSSSTSFHHSFSSSSKKNKNPMVLLASLLAARGAASCTNYQRRYPLHEAVQLALVPPDLLLRPRHTKNQRIEQQQQMFQKQHTDILRLLVAAAPLAMESVDFRGQTPWMLALAPTQTSLAGLQVVLQMDPTSLIREAGPATSCPPLTSKNPIIVSEKEASFRQQVSLALGDCRYEATNESDSCVTWEKTEFMASLFSEKLLHGLLLAGAPAQVLALALGRVAPTAMLERDAGTRQRPLELYVRLQQQQRIQHPQNGSHDLSSRGPSYCYYHHHHYHYNASTTKGGARQEGKFSANVMLNLLLEACPSVASLPCQRFSGGDNYSSGRTLPLHLALQKPHCRRGDGNKNGTVTVMDQYSLPWSWQGSLQHLFHAYPMAVQQRDDQTGLYPFQLAATHATPTAIDETTETKKHDEIITSEERLTMIYEILRGDPSVLRQCKAK
jgi:hypothetical protein